MIIVKNNKVIVDIWVGQSIDPSSTYTLQSVDLEKWRDDLKVNQDILSGDLRVSDGVSYFTNFVEALNFLKGILLKISSMPDPSPFANPIYRTKRMKTSNIETVTANENKEVLFVLASELFTHGGCLVVQNAQLGDWISAEVEDKDAIIPAPYRAALCEAWPVVGEYIPGEWVEVQGEYSVHRIDTSPLIAKITQGLYLSFHYHAINSGVDRKIGVNYYMNKKL